MAPGEGAWAGSERSLREAPGPAQPLRDPQKLNWRLQKPWDDAGARWGACRLCGDQATLTPQGSSTLTGTVGGGTEGGNQAACGREGEWMRAWALGRDGV